MLEMDKTRDDVRRGASRFSPARRQIKQQSGHKLLSALDAGGGDVDFTEKSKKDRIKRLSVVGRANSSHEDYEMGCFGSHEDDELRPQAASPSTSSKKFKLPKRFLDDCNSVDHTSVPRKLRSAMKKRSCESVSPPLPDPNKQNHKIRGLELSERDGSIKKSRLDMKQGSSGISPKRVVAGPITKDEQEVVETLYALAGLFSKNDSTDKSKLGDGFPEANSFAIPEAGEGTRLAFKVPKDIAHPICPSMPAEVLHASPSSVDRSPGKKEFVNDDTLSKPCVSEQHNLEVNKKLNAESFAVPQMKLQTMPLFSETEQRMETRLKKAKQPEVPSSERKLEIALGPATNSGSELQHTIEEGKKNGLAFWPGLCPLPGAEISSPPKSSDAKSPVWLDAPKCVSKPASSRNSFSTEKVSRGAVDRKSWKRCATHVYISRLIQVLQISERRDGQPVQLDQLSAKEGLNRGVLIAPNNLIAVRNGYNEVLSGGVITSSALGKSPNEVRVGAIMHKRLHQDQQQAALPSKAYNLQKQSFDFLSLSAGGGGNEAENSNNRSKNGLESMSQLPIPYLRSFPHNQTPVPFSLHQTHYSSSPSPDQLSATAAQQVPFQLSPYLGNTFCVISQTSSTSSAKLQQQQQQRQHQQQIWAAQLAAQYRPGVTSAAASQFPSWQNGRQNSSSMVQSPSSLEALGPKYLPISPQQQQQLMTITSSLSPARINRQHNPLPSGYEENGIGLMLI